MRLSGRIRQDSAWWKIYYNVPILLAACSVTRYARRWANLILSGRALGDGTRTLVLPPRDSRQRLPQSRLTEQSWNGLTRNFLLLLSVPLGVVTVINPLVAPLGTVAVR